MKNNAVAINNNGYELLKRNPTNVNVLVLPSSFLTKKHP